MSSCKFYPFLSCQVDNILTSLIISANGSFMVKHYILLIEWSTWRHLRLRLTDELKKKNLIQPRACGLMIKSMNKTSSKHFFQRKYSGGEILVIYWTRLFFLVGSGRILIKKKDPNPSFWKKDLDSVCL